MNRVRPSAPVPVISTLSQVLHPPTPANGASQSPNRPALRFTSQGRVLDNWNASELDQAIQSTQRQFLAQLGLGPRDVLAFSLINGASFVVTFLATTNNRWVAAPLNPQYTPQEVAFYLDDMKCKALIVERGEGQLARQAAVELGIPIFDISCDLAARTVTVQKAAQQSDKAKIPTPRSLSSITLPQPVPSDVALILHTSGTTSKPKGVPLTHANLCRSLTNISATYRLSNRDTCMIVMPLFHVHGLMACFLSPLVSGGCCVIPPRFSAQTFWQEFDAAQCNWYSAVPTIHQILLATESKTPSVAHRKRLEFIRSCSSALAPATFHALEKTFGVPVVEAYAMTENSHQMTSNPLPPLSRKPGSVGLGQGVEMVILDSEGKKLPTGKEGEICTRGTNVTPGYLNNPQANAECFTKDGYFRTGDQGYLDAEGYVYITGRLKELINRGGEKIAPLEVDSVLLSAPGVGEAVCFGKPDAKYGQEIVAAVVPKDWKAYAAASPKEKEAFVAAIQNHSRGKLAAFKVPKQIFVDQQLPKTATGKIQRRNIATFFLEKEKKEGGAKITSKL